MIGSRTPWQKIRDAGDKGRGLRLTADEVKRLRFDDAIAMRACNDDIEQGRYTSIDDVYARVPPKARRRYTIEPSGHAQHCHLVQSIGAGCTCRLRHKETITNKKEPEL